jgi:hypothetical protein
MRKKTPMAVVSTFNAKGTGGTPVSRISLLAAAIGVLAFGLMAIGAEAPAGDKVQFNRDVRPILSDTCFKCHGFDKNARQADLRLDVRAEAVTRRPGDGGTTPIVPGDPAHSEIWRRIVTDDHDDLMPPADSNLALTPAQKETIRRWIEQGAEYQPHWSFVPVVQPEAPPVKQAGWARNEIDAFVLSRLEAEGLAPTNETDRRSLIRRVTLDLTGLPPTPAEVEAFVADAAPDAYERVVDRLLASPPYGERMAVDWLDAARYADTHGFNNDTMRSMWRWRDWVIESFNSNQRYDRFLTEQLAGDLLPNATLEQRIATGFSRNHVANSEGGIIEEEYRVEYVADRTRTAGAVFMGLTLECARCHDHKYDPLTQKEYYQLFAFFNQLQEKGEIPRDREPDPNVKAPTAAQQAQLAALAAEVAALEQARLARIALADQTRATWEPQLAAQVAQGPRAPADGLLVHLSMDDAPGNEVADAARPGAKGKLNGAAPVVAGKLAGALKFDGAAHVDLGDVASFERADKFSYGAWVLPADPQGAGAVIARMDQAGEHRGYDLVLSGGRLEAHVVHRWPDNAIRVEAKQPLAPADQWRHVFVTYDGSSKAAGLKIYVDGAPVEVTATNDALTETSKSAVPLLVGRRSAGVAFKGAIDDVRVYGRELSAGEVRAVAGANPLAEILAVAPEQRTPQQQEALRQHYLTTADAEYAAVAAQLDAARKREAELNAAVPTVMVMQDMSPPRQTFMLNRGAYDAPGDPVQPGVPAALPPLPAAAPANRLGLAMWLTDPAHPLTARVAVNRFWYQYFGVGLVKTLEDWGVQGEPPSHPELLDWLAARFVQGGWDVKAFQRLIVTSATYRQATRYDTALVERDPENRLLARGPRMRLSAEAIRDQALAVSGLLVHKLGGPSVMPYQPPGLWEDVVVGAPYPGTVYKQGHGEDLYRRSMYTFWKRTAPPPGLNTFDAPDREFCTIRRPQTNTPLQALVLLNDPTYVEAARKLAERMMAEGGATPGERIGFGFRLATARLPADGELAVLRETFERRLAHYAANADAAAKLLGAGESPRNAALPPAELAAYATVASMILNLDEVITK